MKLEIDNFEQFKIFFDIVYDITEFIELQLFDDYLNCSILDKGHTRYMNVNFSKEFFKAYEVDSEESVILFSEDFHKIIKASNKNDNVVLKTNENYLVCEMESSNGNSRVFEFVLPSDFVQSPQPPSLMLPVSVNIDISILKQGIKDLKILNSGEVQFNVVDDKFSITSGNEINGNYSSSIDLEESCGESSVSRFSLEYIEQLLKFEKLSKVVELKLGSDLPLLYSFEDDDMRVNGLIAPRVELED